MVRIATALPRQPPPLPPCIGAIAEIDGSRRASGVRPECPPPIVAANTERGDAQSPRITHLMESGFSGISSVASTPVRDKKANPPWRRVIEFPSRTREVVHTWLQNFLEAAWKPVRIANSVRPNPCSSCMRPAGVCVTPSRLIVRGRASARGRRVPCLSGARGRRVPDLIEQIPRAFPLGGLSPRPLAHV
jgi:hypothetical protein